MALDVSYAGMNLGSNGIGFDFLDINGQYDLGKLRNINFKIRQSVNGNTENMPAFYQFNYYSTRFGLSLGSQVDFMNYQIDGPGLRLNFRGKNEGSTEVFGINSRIGNVEIAGFKQEALFGEKVSLKTQSLIANDNKYSSTSFFSVHNLNIDLKNRQSIQITGGYSAEKATKIGQVNPGFAFGYRFGFDKKKYSVLSNHISYSAYFPGITRGLTLSQHEIRLYKGRVFFGGLIDYNYREPVLYFEENTNARLEFQIKNYQYGVKVGISRGAFNYSLNGVQIFQVQNSLDNAPMTGQKIQMVFSHVKGRYNQNLNASYTLSKMKDFENNKYQNGYNAFYQLRKNNLGLLLNIDYGINYYFDYHLLKSTSTKPLRENYSVFYEIKSKSENINERINLAMIRNAAGTPPALILRNEFDIQIPKIKASINILAGINVLNISQTPNFNIIFKKTLDVPMAIKPRFYDLGLFIFKDKNNNEIFDKGDEPIENAMLGVNGNQVLTNVKGQATIKNMAKGDYLIDLKKIYNLKGWIPKKGLKDSVTINGKTMVGIPFKMSKVISGKITYVAEYATDATPPSLSGILVVAVNQKGEVFKTLTNMSGEFFFNLNDDVYNIQIPENVFSNNLFIEKSIKRVDLRTENGSSLEFKVMQKKRKINIKKD
jgi:hypothetical protein